MLYVVCCMLYEVCSMIAPILPRTWLPAFHLSVVTMPPYSSPSTHRSLPESIHVMPSPHRIPFVAVSASASVPVPVPELIHPMLALFNPLLPLHSYHQRTPSSIQAAPFQQRSYLPSLLEPAREARLLHILPALLHFHKIVREYNQHPVPENRGGRSSAQHKLTHRLTRCLQSPTGHSYLYK